MRTHQALLNKGHLHTEVAKAQFKAQPNSRHRQTKRWYHLRIRKFFVTFASINGQMSCIYPTALSQVLTQTYLPMKHSV